MSEADDSGRALARRVPLDLVAAVALAVLSAAVLLATDTGSPVTNLLSGSPRAVLTRVATLALGVAFLLFLPGYAVVSALFPGHEPAVEKLDDEGEPVAPRFEFRSREGIDVLERLALAVGLSAAVTPGVALVVNFTPWGLHARPVAVAIAGFVVVTSVVAAVRRLRTPPERRFAPTLRLGASRAFSGSGSHTTANVVLAVGVVVAVAGIGYAVAVPKPGSQFTELSLLDETQNGTLVAGGYNELTAGEPTEVIVGVGNHEGEAMNYTVVVQLQRVNVTNDTVTVLERNELARTNVSVAAGAERNLRLSVRPTMTGYGHRLQILLFRGDPPANATAAEAYRTVSAWVTIRTD